jgi:elongation factor Ts
MSITAAMVKELRERTGAGMMECKKALVETNGDLEAAIEHMRKSGMAKAEKKAGRTAAEGLMIVKVADDHKRAAMVEVNCETDFVTKGDDFRGFADSIGNLILDKNPDDLAALMALAYPGTDKDVETTLKELIAKIGENMNIRRFVTFATSGLVDSYLHGTRIGVVVELAGGDNELARDIAMHVAASRPVCVDETGVSADVIEKEREIYTAQAADSGKPAEIVAKMVEGRVKKFLKEVTLLGQPFVKNPDVTIEQLLKEKGAKVISFARYEVGEGIEKRSENFAEEVMAQAQAQGK